MKGSFAPTLCALALAATSAASSHVAYAANNGRDYLSALQQTAGLNSVGGISVAKVFSDGADPSTALDMPISQLNAVLHECTMGGGGSGGYPGIKAWSVDYRFFECLKADAPFSSLLVILPFDRDGKLTAVYVKAGGQFQQTSPAPRTPPNKAAE